MTFKIGDEVIMTADSEKGKTYPKVDGDYKGVVTQIDRNGVKVEFENIPSFWFEYNGICSGDYLGMSIRPVIELDTFALKTNNFEIKVEFIKNGSSELTPSQWIKGEVPQDYQGWVILGRYDLPDGDIQWKQRSTQVLDIKYSHYILIQLPPPPLIAEVEAYGYLERVEQIRKCDNLYSNVETINEIDKALAFYSQLTTVENLEKYFTRKEKEYNLPNSRAGNIDEYIAQSKGYNLIFTPAALDMLGIK